MVKRTPRDVKMRTPGGYEHTITSFYDNKVHHEWTLFGFLNSYSKKNRGRNIDEVVEERKRQGYTYISG